MKDKKEMRVLIVEDDYLVSKLIENSLEEIGYTIIGEATTGLEAVEMTCSLKPNVVLMDIRMPQMDGLEATRHIYDKCPTPIVALTAYDEIDLVKEAGEAGMGAYLVKPPTIHEIERAITIAIARFDDMMQLRHLNQQLQIHVEELDAFAHTVSHQLKNSISLIITFSRILKEKLDIPKESALYLDSIVESGHKMDNIIHELQLLAGVRKDSELELQPLEMGTIVEEAQQRLSYMIQEHQAQITTPESWPVAWGYAPWIEEVWVNYIGNAIKHGGDPPQIRLGATPQQETVRFWVQDTGEGLSSEEQKNLFKPFVRLNKSQVQGQGLGLSIVRHIIEKLGGEVGIESNNVPGQGSIFSFTLPRK